MVRIFSLLSAVLALLLSCSQPCRAISRFWDDGGAGSNWSTAANWSPDGVPDSVDDVFIGHAASAIDDLVLLDVADEMVASLSLINGADFDTNGRRLKVNGQTTIAQSTLGPMYSQLIVSPFSGDNALDTGALTILAASELKMMGGSVSVDGTGVVEGVLRNERSILGHGVINLDDDVPNVTDLLVNEGILNVSAFAAPGIDPAPVTLKISVSDILGEINLGGDTHGGQVIVGRNATLDLDAHLSGSQMTGSISLQANATLDTASTFRLQGPDGSFPRLIVSSGATETMPVLPAAPAIITGQSFILGDNGRIELDEGDEVLRFDSFFFSSEGVFENSGEIHFAGGGRISQPTSFVTGGAGRLINDLGSSLLLDDQLDAATPITNEGELGIGFFAADVAQSTIESFTQTATGVLGIEIRDVLPADIDLLTVDGNATLGGSLDITLLDSFEPVLGNSFTILETTFGNVSGTFDTENLPEFGGLTFDVVYNPTSVVLEVISSSPFSADFDGDGDVDADDLGEWVADYGGPGSDADGDGDSDGSDFLAWQRQFGSGVSALATVAVPEPSAFLLLASSLVLLAGKRRS